MVSAWDGFHVYVRNKLKSFYSFQKQCSMSNLFLVGYNERFFYCHVGVAGSTHDSRMLRSASFYEKIISGKSEVCNNGFCYAAKLCISVRDPCLL